MLGANRWSRHNTPQHVSVAQGVCLRISSRVNTGQTRVRWYDVMYVKWYYVYLLSSLQSVDEMNIDITFDQSISQFKSWQFYLESGQLKLFENPYSILSPVWNQNVHAGCPDTCSEYRWETSASVQIPFNVMQVTTAGSFSMAEWNSVRGL